eukprot:25913-Prymnesium_polylepis.1
MLVRREFVTGNGRHVGQRLHTRVGSGSCGPLRPRGIVHRKAPRVWPRCSPPCESGRATPRPTAGSARAGEQMEAGSPEGYFDRNGSVESDVDTSAPRRQVSTGRLRWPMAYGAP